MNTKNKFMRIAFASALLSLTGSALSADENTSQPMKQQSTDNSRQQTMAPALGDKMPPYNNPDRFVLQGSFIYWQADMDGLDYALQQNAVVTTPSNATNGNLVQTASLPSSYTDTLKQKDLDFKWEPGFKLGVGMIFGERDQWDILLNWTWIRPKAHRSLNSGPTPNISPLSTTLSNQFNPVVPTNVSTAPTVSTLAYQVPGFSPLLLQSPATSSQTNWRLLYNTVDLELGRNFFLAKNLTLRPHMGLRGAFLHHTTESHYNISSTSDVVNQINDTFVVGSASGTSRFKGKNEYDAVGLRGGLDIRWNFTNHFCVYGSVSGAILYGIFSIKEDFDTNYTVVQTSTSKSIVGSTTTTVTPVTTDADFKTNLHRTRSTLQAALGLMWHTGFSNDKYHASIGASYEVNQWFQQNELRDIQNTLVDLKANRTPGDLGLHGFTLDVKFDF
ncbi:MAG: hypothetical protein HKM07_07475 [Chlamydiae bacterium]|nr:hypothetical protein [Chlamydiota bacterium]